MLRGAFVTECVSRGHFGLALLDHPFVLRWLHEVVGINGKNGAATENQCSGVKYMGK